ncbi:hypothetical protein ACHHYP_20725 [Achlya hypogyna]|uniref:Uncharacterized protein n=1 Tax=Achlya hypogyna TaxID=1202772 RepID=A0A1V9YDD6_ACHHY|nr:hypothetical protein ACHHYP_20725 [Achlya hypogyna]
MSHAIDIWRGRHRRRMLRFVQAAVAPSSASSWISPGEALFAAAYSPWGSFRDLLFADPRHQHILILLRSTLLPKTSKLLLTDWFDIRSSPYVAPVLDATEQTLALPLWHNEFLPIHQRDDDVWKGWHQRYAKPMALIGCTHVHHLVRAMLCLPSFHHTIATRCSVAGVSLPSTRWLGRLAHAVRRMIPFLTSAISPNQRPAILDTDPAKLVPSWLVKLDGRVVPLPRGTTRAASRIFKAAAQRKSLPTAYINIANDFYGDPDKSRGRRGVVAPEARLAQLHYLEDKTCVLCNTGDLETYTHLLIACPFTQDIWNLFTATLSAFGFSYPTSLQACLFDTSRLQRRDQRPGPATAYPEMSLPAGPAWHAAFPGKTTTEAQAEFLARGRSHAIRDGPGAMIPAIDDPEAYVPGMDVRQAFPGSDRWAALSSVVKLCKAIESRSPGQQPDPEPGADPEHDYAEILSPRRNPRGSANPMNTVTTDNHSTDGLYRPLIAPALLGASTPRDEAPSGTPTRSHGPSGRYFTAPEEPHLGTSVVLETLVMVRDVLHQMKTDRQESQATMRVLQESLAQLAATRADPAPTTILGVAHTPQRPGSERSECRRRPADAIAPVPFERIPRFRVRTPANAVMYIRSVEARADVIGGEPGHCGIVFVDSLETAETVWVNNILAREGWEITELTHDQWASLVELFYDRFVGNSAARSRLFDSVAQTYQEKVGFERVDDYVGRLTAYSRVAGREGQERLLIDKAVDGIRDPALAIAVLPYVDMASWDDFQRQLVQVASRLKLGLLGHHVMSQLTSINAVEESIDNGEATNAEVFAVQQAPPYYSLQPSQAGRRGPLTAPSHGPVALIHQQPARGDCSLHGTGVGHTDAECSILNYFRRNPSATQALAAAMAPPTSTTTNNDPGAGSSTQTAPAASSNEDAGIASGFGEGRQ